MAQTVFSTQSDVVDYMEGEWNLDVVRGGFAGGTYYLPSPLYFDSTVHKFVFKKTGIDSTPLLCRALIDDTLYQEVHVKVSMNPSQEILPRWLLLNMPHNLYHTLGIMEERGFYGFAQDTIVLGGNIPADGYDFGLRRLRGTGTQESNDHDNIQVYPNPSDGVVFVEGLVGKIEYKLFDMKGAKIKSGILDDNLLHIDNTGIYTVQLKVGEGWVSRKVVIEK
jgi:hypothetical protein